MCGNRVEELEEQVNQLQATVDGLTDELVECKVRIRELENAVDEDIGFSPDSESDIEEQSTEPAEGDNREEPDATDDEESTESDSDIIIA
ncbi:MAG: bZIP transcription factor [Halapricum sp.]